MYHFKGFKKGQNLNTGEISQVDSGSNSEVSDYETVADSRETTPTRSYSNIKVNTVQKKKSDRTSVRELIEHFSSQSSDSETGSEQARHTRRRKSSAEHIQLPPGGEKEIKRKMAEQAKAEQLVSVYQAMRDEFATSMNETDQALDADASRNVMIGHLAGLNSEFEDLEKYFSKVEEISEKPGVVINFLQIVLARNKIKTRYNRLKGHIMASTEKDSVALPSTLRIANPTSFGSLKLPEFYGDYVEF